MHRPIHWKIHRLNLRSIFRLIRRLGAETPADVPESDAPADQPDNEALRASLEREVLSFAREWVVDHIVKADLDLKPYLREYPRNFV